MVFGFPPLELAVTLQLGLVVAGLDRQVGLQVGVALQLVAGPRVDVVLLGVEKVRLRRRRTGFGMGINRRRHCRTAIRSPDQTEPERQ